MSKNKFFVILLLSGLAGLTLSLYQHRESSPHETIQTFHRPATFVKQIQGDPLAGEKIFKEFCGSCHAPKPFIQLNAPRKGDQKDGRS